VSFSNFAIKSNVSSVCIGINRRESPKVYFFTRFARERDNFGQKMTMFKAYLSRVMLVDFVKTVPNNKVDLYI
jgi:hypothetical protein